MNEWLDHFYKEKDATLTIKGRIYKCSECTRIGGGAEKHVYQLKNEKICFFIPSKCTGEAQWNSTINLEKFALDKMSKLGLKTQQFEIAPIEIHAPGKPSYKINALLTKNFENLCIDDSIIIYNPKNNHQMTIGIPPNFLAMKEQFKNKAFVQKMFKKIITEYAIAYTFSFPISILQNIDDSEHICFELFSSPKAVPVARYMFWDVASDFKSSLIPMVPTLEKLKKGPYQRDRENHALLLLAESVACAIDVFTDFKLNPGALDLEEVIADFIKGIEDDSFLNKALISARKITAEYFSKFLTEKATEAEPTSDKLAYLVAAVSTENLELVKQSYQLFPKNVVLLEEDIDTVLEISATYNNSLIMEYLNSKLGPVKLKTQREAQRSIEINALKQQFLDKYQAQLISDECSYWGLYSFFAKSYLKKASSLAEMVQHAQGLSKVGSGKRSQLIMRRMNWLDENNQVTGELKMALST